MRIRLSMRLFLHTSTLRTVIRTLTRTLTRTFTRTLTRTLARTLTRTLARTLFNLLCTVLLLTTPPLSLPLFISLHLFKSTQLNRFISHIQRGSQIPCSGPSSSQLSQWLSPSVPPDSLSSLLGLLSQMAKVK